MDLVLFFHTSMRESWRKELTGAYRFAKAAKWRIQIVEPTAKPPDVGKLLEFWNPAGCIVECSGREDGYFDAARFGRVPTVFIGRDPRTLPKRALCVNTDPSGPGRIAARALMAAGLSNFAFLALRGDLFWSRDRETYFRRALRLNGHSCATFCASRPGATEEKRLMAWLRSLPKPCGLFAENDYAAATASLVASRAGIRIPSELSIIGVDDDSALCENNSPRLSSVFLDFEGAGYAAANMLDDAIRGNGVARRIATYPATSLIRRGSTPHVYAGSAPPQIARAVALIREKADEGIGAAEVAATIGGSRRTADARFRIATGKSILEAIHDVRFEKVLYLLRHRGTALGSIADMTGWGSQAALRAAFQKRFGMPMRKWRRLARQG